MKRRTLIGGIAAAFALAVAPAALAQAYPTKPVTLIVPFAAGGTTDIVARVVSAKITPHLGQTMVVENKGGGGGVIGAQLVAQAQPNGYTLGVATVSTVATVPALNPKTPYNPLTAFTPIINMAATPNVISVHPSFPAKDYKSFLEEIKKNPDKYAYASTGTGAITHMQMELFKNLTGARITHVPYRGAGPALQDVVAGNVPIILDNLPSSLPFIKEGKLIPIVVASPERSKALPNVPTFKEVGLEPANRVAWYGVVGPKGLPKDIVDKLHSAVKKTLEEPDVRKRIEETGSIVVANTPEQFAQQIKEEYEVYKRVTAEQKLQPE